MCRHSPLQCEIEYFHSVDLEIEGKFAIMSPTTRAYSFIARLQSHFNQERNYPSVLCSIGALITLIISLADHRWFWLNGGGCNAKYIGLNMFFTIGKLFVIRKANPWDSSGPMNEIYQFKSNDYTGRDIIHREGEKYDIYIFV